VPNFISVTTSVAELACGKKSHTQSLTQSVYLISWSSPRSETKALGWLQSAVTECYVLSAIFLLIGHPSLYNPRYIFHRLLKVRTSSSSPRL